MSTPATVTGRLNRSWIRVYTIGLGPELRTDRLAEVNSDLWEHELDDQLNGVAVRSTAWEMLARLASGMPADLAWRLEQRRPMTRSVHMLTAMQQNSWQRNALWALSSVLIVFLLVTGVAIAITMEESSLGAKIAYGSAVFLCGVLILAGFVVTEREPRLGVALLLIGTVGGSLLMWWFLFIPPVVALVVAVFGFRRAKGFSAGKSDLLPPGGGAPA